MAQVTEQRDALIVAHGSPSDPAPQEARLTALASAVEALASGLRVRGATLAMPGSLECAVEAMTRPLIYPFFMASGWFTRTLLPRRLAACGVAGVTHLDPFGLDRRLPLLVAQAAEDAARRAALPIDGAVLLAAHGSQASRGSRTAADAIVAKMRALRRFAHVDVGFIEEEPRLADVARDLLAGVCVPLFALSAGHVVDDVPAALREASFDGPTSPPIGERPETPALIAEALMRACKDPSQCAG